MKKYYCYDNYSKDLKMRNLQIVYLYYVEDLKPSQIAQIVGLAASTVTSYRYKYEEYLNEAEELFTSTAPRKNYDIEHDYANRIFADSKNTNKFYLLKISNLMTGELITSKIGTTRQPINTRVSRIYKDYEKIYNCPVHIEIKRVYDCRQITPICFESFFRFEYILQYGEHYVENDRFENMEFDYEKADKLYTSLIKRIEKVAQF